MAKIKKERRKYLRYDTEVKVAFVVKYDLRTRVKFRKLPASRNSGQEYCGFSRNISVEGICFVAGKKLRRGDFLQLSVYPPKMKNPVLMEGRVLWSKRLLAMSGRPDVFYTGLNVLTVGGQPVKETIHYDQEYKIFWSAVLESVFGSFAVMMKRLCEESKGR